MQQYVLDTNVLPEVVLEELDRFKAETVLRR